MPALATKQRRNVAWWRIVVRALDLIATQKVAGSNLGLSAFR